MKKIKLTKPHEHAGRNYPAGAVLELATDAADWLIAVGTAEEPRKTAPQSTNQFAAKENE